MAQKALTEEQITKACHLYEDEKMTSTQIAKIFNVNSETIRKWMKLKGIKMRTSGQSMSSGLNHDYFNIIDSERKAYWLGFILADGCIGKSCGTRRSLRFYLAEKDKNSIHEFASDIEFGGKLRIDKTKNQVGICFNSPILTRDLIDYGVLDWKRNGDSRILRNIPNNLFNHFVRGFFDGDGSIIVRQRSDRPSKSYTVTFAADHNQIECMNILEKMIAKEVGLSINGSKKRSTGVSLRWNGNKQIKKLGEWLYSDANIYMERKKDRFDALNGGCDFEFNQVVIIDGISDSDYVPFYDKYHYMGTGGRRGLTIGAMLDSKLIASCTFGPITRKEIAIRKGVDSKEMRELVRFCIHPNYHKKNFASWFMGKCIKLFRKNYKDVTMLVSFADSTEGHEGIIYKATNWEYDGITGKSYHYENEDGKKIHKKTVFDTAKKLGMKEVAYYKENGLTKVKHEPKHRYFFKLR